MVRLSVGVAREEAAARRGGLVGYPAPYSATAMMSLPPGPDLRRVLAGPFASDWHDLSTQEKFGRIAEGAVYYGLIYGILSLASQGGPYGAGSGRPPGLVFRARFWYPRAPSTPGGER